MKEKPQILITNDDGINAPGIFHLAASLQGEFNTTISAPDSQKSGSGLGISVKKPLHVKEVSWQNDLSAWSISGTPADCVKMALSVLLEKKPDLIVSGINKGTNSGRNVLYSGTIGGIIEGVFRGIPGIAFSCEDIINPQYQDFTNYIPRIVNYFLKHPIPYGSLINITFPSVKPHKIKGFKMAKQGKSYYIDNVDKRIHPDGLPYYWLGGKPLACEEDENSDVALLQEGYITATPLHVEELTNHKMIEEHEELFAKLFIS